jgi:hypothetical protein
MTTPIAAWLMLTTRVKTLAAASGGVPKMTQAEAARFLQGLKRGPFLMGMAVNCGATEVLGELESYMWRYVRDLAEGLRENENGELVQMPNFNAWPLCHGQQYCRRIAILAIYECLIPRPIRCARCLGRGYIVLHGQEMPCDDVIVAGRVEKRGCNNSGGQKLSARQRADLIGIPWTSWRDGWNWRYEMVLAEASGWYGDSMRHMADALESMQDAA